MSGQGEVSRRAVLAAGLASVPIVAMAGKKASMSSPSILKAPALRPGDTVALIAPASQLAKAEEAEDARRFIESLGFRPIFGLNSMKASGYLAGTDEERVADLNWALRDDAIQGIVCLRGGYGAMRLLPHIDYQAAIENPKVLVGYSDITALLVALNKKTGLVCFHGPVATSTDIPYSTGWLKKAVTTSSPLGLLSQPEPSLAGKGDFVLSTIHGGKARGRLIGGNLTILSNLMGTPYAPDLAGKILFFEDITEAPYRIDRMLTQIWLSGALQKVKGIVVGQLTNCDEQEPASPWKCKDVIQMRFKDLGVPVLAGVAIGHVQSKLTLPVGAMAELDADQKTITVLESGVV